MVLFSESENKLIGISSALSARRQDLAGTSYPYVFYVTYIELERPVVSDSALKRRSRATGTGLLPVAMPIVPSSRALIHIVRLSSH